jgi:drug/metabolite transporter (DMT)-like permease
MSLSVAVPYALLSAVAYGTATAVQHTAAHTGAGRADARGLLRLLRNPRWLLSVCGDGLGLVFQIAALAAGPVVVVQPLLVLAVPVALPVGSLLGGRRPRWGDYLACAAIIGGLGAFFLVVGDPGAGEPLAPAPAAVAIVIAMMVGGALCGAVRHRSPPVRATVYGGVAGASFGLVGVLLDATATTWRVAGWDGFRASAGWGPLVGLLVVGAVALILTQVSFQVGALSASFPANEATAPVVAVALGAALLHEKVPGSLLALTAYGTCLACILAGTVWLARSWAAPPGRSER